MSYTPTTEEVREIYRGCLVQTDTNIYSFVDEAQADGEFDRWLAEVKAQVWDECSYAYMGKIFETAITGEGILRLNNPYLQESHATDSD